MDAFPLKWLISGHAHQSSTHQTSQKRKNAFEADGQGRFLDRPGSRLPGRGEALPAVSQARGELAQEAATDGQGTQSSRCMSAPGHSRSRKGRSGSGALAGRFGVGRLGSRREKRSMVPMQRSVDEKQSNAYESPVGDHPPLDRESGSHAPPWLRRCMSLRASSRTAATSGAPAPPYRDLLQPEISLAAPVPEFGRVPGLGYEPPRLSPDLSSGAAARAAVAAQNEMLASMRMMTLAEPKVNRDSESGVGIEATDALGSILEPLVPTIRQDPARVLPPELMSHILSFIDARSMLHAALVSRIWYQLANLSCTWKQIYRAEYGDLKDSIVRDSRSGNESLWKSLWKTQKALRQRWQDGHAAAIYLEGHTDSVYCVQFDKDKILTGSRDCTVRVWDTRTYECIKVLGRPMPTRTAESPPLPEDDQELGQRPFARVFSPHTVASPAPEGRSPAHDGSILCLQYDDNMMVTGSSDSSLIVWDVPDNYNPVRRLLSHTSGVLDVCFDATYIVSCSKDASVKIWRRKDGQLARSLSGHRGPVNAVQLRGSLVVSASGDGVAKLWNLTTGLCIKEFPSKDRGMACVEFSPDSRTILAGGNDHVIYQFDANSGELVRELTGHVALVRSLHLDTRTGRVVSGSYDSSVRAFDLVTGDTITNLTRWTSSWILSAKADFRRIVATSQDSRAVIIDFGHQLPGIETLEARLA